VLTDVPIALPQLIGAYTGDRMAQVVLSVLEDFGITSLTIRYFVLDNAYNNDAVVATIADKIGFTASYRWLCCSPHTLNLIS
jgi:hypothetical protein